MDIGCQRLGIAQPTLRKTKGKRHGEAHHYACNHPPRREEFSVVTGWIDRLRRGRHQDGVSGQCAAGFQTDDFERPTCLYEELLGLLGVFRDGVQLDPAPVQITRFFARLSFAASRRSPRRSRAVSR